MQVLTEIEVRERHIRFGVANSAEEREEVFAQRLRVYRTEGYFKDPAIARDEDAFDARAVFFLGKDAAGTILASARLVLGAPDEKLPVEICYSFTEPVVVREIPKIERAEIGRFVTERPRGIPAFVLPLGLFEAIVAYSACELRNAGLSFIKGRFHAGLALLGIRIHRIEEFTLSYPEDGPLAPYFYGTHEPFDEVFPVYYLLDDAIIDVETARRTLLGP